MSAELSDKQLRMFSFLVYFANKALLADDVGRRLENFFWRIWGNRRIRDRLRGSQVARQFSAISEGAFIRTTPTQSPRSSRSRRNHGSGPHVSDVSSASSSPSLSHGFSPSSSGSRGANVPDLEADDSFRPRLAPSGEAELMPRMVDAHTPRPHSSWGKRSDESSSFIAMGPKGPPPHLPSDERSTIRSGKAADPSQAGGPSACTPRQREKGWLDAEQAASAAEGGEAPDVLDRESAREMVESKARITGEDATESQHTRRMPARKNTVIRIKSRPSTGQSVLASGETSRQPSSSESSNVTAMPVSGAETTTPTLKTVLEEYVRGAEAPRTMGSRPGSPRLSMRHGENLQDEPPDVDVKGNPPRSKSDGFEDGLVDRDFRSKFAARTQKERQNLAGFAPSVRRFDADAITSAAYDTTETMDPGPPNPTRDKGKRKVQCFGDTTLVQPSDAAELNMTDEGPVRALPRTTSELTLLLERSKRPDGEKPFQ